MPAWLSYLVLGQTIAEGAGRTMEMPKAWRSALFPYYYRILGDILYLWAPKYIIFKEKSLKGPPFYGAESLPIYKDKFWYIWLNWSMRFIHNPLSIERPPTEGIHLKDLLTLHWELSYTSLFSRWCDDYFHKVRIWGGTMIIGRLWHCGVFNSNVYLSAILIRVPLVFQDRPLNDCGNP